MNKIAFLFLLSVFAAGCSQEPLVRQYEEQIIKSPLNSASAASLPTNQSPLTWAVPVGWIENPGSGMRLATFLNSENNPTIECTLIQLAGSAGGLKPNIVRWMGQVGIDSLSDNEVDRFISELERYPLPSGGQGILVDLTSLHGDAVNSEVQQSILSLVLEDRGLTVFVKMMGSISEINKNRDQFVELTESIRFK